MKLSFELTQLLKIIQFHTIVLYLPRYHSIVVELSLHVEFELPEGEGETRRDFPPTVSARLQREVGERP
jgi:hypothetical protein